MNMRSEAFALIMAMSGASLLAACDREEAAMPAHKPPEQSSEMPKDCNEVAAGFAGQWVGKPYEGLRHMLEISRVVHVTRTRFFEKGSMLTMDHIPTRLNVEYDKDGKITRIFCG
ncbi:MAG: hypothetical protein CMI59_06340 [Parvibaculum sp.]|nr:hypothetical protein [Parvibaculum sp.]